MSYANSPPKYKTTLIIQNYSPFLSRMIKGKSLRGRQLISTGKASILILIIIVSTIIAILICRSLRRRRWRSGETTEASLSSCNTTDTGVHLIQLSSESIKGSIHALKLCHDGLESHTTTWRGRSGGGWSRTGWRSRYLGPWPLQSKLGLAPSNEHHANGTHDGEMRRLGIRNRGMTNDPRDGRRTDKLIIGHRILIDIYKGEYEMRGKVNGKVLNKG